MSIPPQNHLQSSVFSPQLLYIPKSAWVIYYICAVTMEHKMHWRSVMDWATYCFQTHISFSQSHCEQKCRAERLGEIKKRAFSQTDPNALFKSSLRRIHYTSCLLRQPSCRRENINNILPCRFWANSSASHRPPANVPLSSAMTQL